MSTLFIAEVDERGDVTWVWQKKDEDRFAHPAKPHSLQVQELRTAEFFGAHPALIADWLRVRHSA